MNMHRLILINYAVDTGASRGGWEGWNGSGPRHKAHAQGLLTCLPARPSVSMTAARSSGLRSSEHRGLRAGAVWAPGGRRDLAHSPSGNADAQMWDSHV